ncbi:MAG: AAA family ATPase, partial [Chitinophagales bacterium]
MTERLIYESKKSKIYLQDESEWDKPVLLKVLNYEFPAPIDIAQFYNEYEMLEDLNMPGIRNVLKRTKAKNRHAIFLEWIEAPTLSEAFKNKQGDIIDFLYIAIAIAQAVGEIHRNNIIHKDITPFNILVNLQKREVKLIDFGISSKIDLKQTNLGNPERLEGTLAYNSPEQTGRMNRVVDYRTDLYSMGVVFYEMLTGQLPFPVNDAMELVHSHIAQIPKPCCLVNTSVPKPISDIINILMAKNAEDRYQSAFGVKHDLEICLSQYESRRKVEDFQYRQNDFSGKFQIPQKLYGREKEIALLLEAFERCAEGNLELILVAGYSGTGKSALVREVHKPITKKHGYFIEGKYDQFQRAVPYYAILQAFREFVNILLTEREETLSKLRTEIQEAVGAEGKVLTEVIPNLEFIIGKQPDVPVIGGSESQNRFNYVFRKFVNVISASEHPLILFIDDLQWADSASISLLNVLITDKHNGHFLCIGAYRNNEVNASHPFIIAKEEMEVKGSRISTITIGNLSKENVNDLIAESVGAENETTLELTELVYEKTQGNAFFVNQFLKSLYQEKLLTFDFESHTWKWNVQRVKEQNITDNVVELMARKILRLPEPTQRAMKFAACI